MDANPQLGGFGQSPLRTQLLWLSATTTSPGDDRRDSLLHGGNRCNEYVFEGDGRGLFQRVDHTALTQCVRQRVVDKRVLARFRTFLKPGVLTHDSLNRRTRTSTAQGGTGKAKPEIIRRLNRFLAPKI